MGWLGLTIGFVEQFGKHLSRLFQHFGEGLLPIRNLTFALAAGTPKEVIRMRAGSRRYVAQLLGYIMGEQDIDRSACLALYFCLIEKQRVVFAQFIFWKARCITGPKAAPPQKLEIGAQ